MPEAGRFDTKIPNLADALGQRPSEEPPVRSDDQQKRPQEKLIAAGHA